MEKKWKDLKVKGDLLGGIRGGRTDSFLPDEYLLQG